MAPRIQSVAKIGSLYLEFGIVTINEMLNKKDDVIMKNNNDCFLLKK